MTTHFNQRKNNSSSFFNARVENALQSEQMLSSPKKIASSFYYDTVGMHKAWQGLSKSSISYLLFLLIGILQKTSCISENFLKSCKEHDFVREFSTSAFLSKLL